MCNQTIKFGTFAERAFSQGADFVATGHYARVEHASEAAGLANGPGTLGIGGPPVCLVNSLSTVSASVFRQFLQEPSSRPFYDCDLSSIKAASIR